MNNERIQEIKRRWQAEMDAFQNHDIAYLLSEVERLQTEIKSTQYPKATGRDLTYGGWRLDYKFLLDIQNEIEQSSFNEDCPSMEQIELALLYANEVMKKWSISHLKG